MPHGRSREASRGRIAALAAHVCSAADESPTTEGLNEGGPLAGYKILEVTEVVSGPLAGSMLQDMGADCVKVEPLKPAGDGGPPVGDQIRGAGTSYTNDDGDKIATLFALTNRGKRSIGLDLSTEKGRELVLELAKDADVFTQNWRPGVAERLRLTYDDLKTAQPDIIYAGVSGYGQSGPKRDEKVYDPVIQSAVGLAYMQGEVWHNHDELYEDVPTHPAAGVPVPMTTPAEGRMPVLMQQLIVRVLFLCVCSCSRSLTWRVLPLDRQGHGVHAHAIHPGRAAGQGE